MVRNQYDYEQSRAIDEVRGIVRQIIELEELGEVAHQPQFGVDGYLRSAEADLKMDSYPPYEVLEERLRNSVISARELGLSEDDFIKKVGKLAFAS